MYKNNYAFIDGQNLYLGTTKSDHPWFVDLKKFRIYLDDKYNVKQAYYFLGYVNDIHQNIYDKIQEAGFILKFREHSSVMLGKKKGNVDTDIVFEIMKKLYRDTNCNKIVLVSGDGDYKKLVDFLIEEGRFEKILFPNKKFASSLYKKITHVYYAHLEDIKNKIALNKERGTLGN